MYPRILNLIKGKKSYFLFGPRGTGKSTWIKEVFRPDVYIDLLEDETYQYLQINPSRLSSLITIENPSCIVIDEIQKIPALTDEVHRLIENKKYTFLLTGSSARKLKKSHANLLAGRALEAKFYPLTAKELGKDFNLIESLEWGHLPSIFSEPDKRKFLKTYVNTYLREEILQEGIIRNVATFLKFLEVASFSQASVLNVSNIARDVGRDSKVINDYFQILEDLLIGVRLPVFSKKAKRSLITHQKFYYFDVGVFRALRPMGPLDNASAISGHAFETLLFQEIRALNDYLDLNLEISYWHTKDHKEVDFILYGVKGLFAIEAKSSSKFHSEDIKTLKLFRDEFPIAKCFLIYGGKKELIVDDVKIVPIEKFLLHMEKYLL